jgi:hypothetical protein
MKPAILALALTLGVCLFVPSMARADEGQQCPSDPVDMFISYGADIICAIDQPGNSDLFRFDGTAGERIKIYTVGTSSPCIELVGVTTACDSRYSQFSIDTVLPKTQEYTIRVFDGRLGTGTFNLFLERTVPQSPNARQITYGQNLADKFGLAGDLDEFFFTASVGDLVDITTVSGSGSPCIALYAPDAKTAWSACDSRYHNFELRQALTLAGNYTILIFDPNSSTADYTVTLKCLAGPCVVTQIPDVSGYITLRGTPLSGTGVSLAQPGAPGPQLTSTDMNGYYQFLHIISGQPFTVFVKGPVSDDSGKRFSGDAAKSSSQ